MAATAVQFEAFANERLRRIAEKTRELQIEVEDYMAVVPDIYEFAVNNPEHTARHAGNPPYLVTGQLLLGAHDFVYLLDRLFNGTFNGTELGNGMANTGPTKFLQLRKVCKNAPVPG